jgi:hypothetical protein
MALVLLPAVLFGPNGCRIQISPTERVAAGVPTSEMLKEVLKPFFLVWFSQCS